MEAEEREAAVHPFRNRLGTTKTQSLYVPGRKASFDSGINIHGLSRDASWEAAKPLITLVPTKGPVWERERRNPREWHEEPKKRAIRSSQSLLRSSAEGPLLPPAPPRQIASAPSQEDLNKLPQAKRAAAQAAAAPSPPMARPASVAPPRTAATSLPKVQVSGVSSRLPAGTASRLPALNRPRPINYKAKYDAETVLIARDFFEELQKSETVENTAQVVDRTGEPRELQLDPATRAAVLAELGDGNCTFRRLLTLLYPLANKRDIVSMIALAYPPQEQLELPKITITQEQREELRQVFRLFDTDGSGAITAEEFAKAVRHLKLPRYKIAEMMTSMDTDGDGLVQEEEFIKALECTYF